jgi:hypothetical protein
MAHDALETKSCCFTTLAPSQASLIKSAQLKYSEIILQIQGYSV